jgi:hypothetical protein
VLAKRNAEACYCGYLQVFQLDIEQASSAAPMRIIYSVLFAICVFAITRFVAYLFDLDEKAKALASFALKLPITQSAWAAVWLVSALISLVALIAAVIFDPWSRIADFFSPRPQIGSLISAPDPVFKLEVNRSNGTAQAELYVEVINQNDQMILFDAELRATVNGRDLDAPIRTNGYVAAHDKQRLIVRMQDVPVIAQADAAMRYDVKYYFKKGARSRHTRKGVHWHLQRMPVPSGEPRETRFEVSTDYFDQIEE